MADRPTVQQPDQPATPSSPVGVSVTDVRRLWPEVLVRLKEIKRTPWSLISQESTVVDVANAVLTLSFRQSTLRDTFTRREDFQENLRQAMADVLGVELKVEAIVDPSGGGAHTGSARPNPMPMPPTAESGPPSSEGPTPASGTAATGPVAPRRAASRDRSTSTGRHQPEDASPSGEPDDGAHPDDNDLDDSGAPAQQLLERTLGARVIEEIEHS